MHIFQSLTDPKLAELLQGGAVGVIPTDTVYGLVAAASNQSAVQRIYNLKARNEQRPGTVIAANIDQLVGLGLKERYLKAVSQYWPGAVSVLIPHADSNYLVDAQSKAIGVRIPNHPQLLRLLEQTGPLQTSSANLTGQPTATDLTKAQSYFGDTVDFYVDGGDLAGHMPSTVIRIVDDAIEVVRAGAVQIDESGRIT